LEPGAQANRRGLCAVAPRRRATAAPVPRTGAAVITAALPPAPARDRQHGVPAL